MTLEIKPRNKYMGHSTGNDLESNDILDFSDNCENLDVLMNADQEYWTDRLGNKRPTIDYALRMAGFTPAGFDFTTGGVLKNGDRNKCVFNQADQTWYSWSGDLPYNVIAGSTPGEGWKVVVYTADFLSYIKPVTWSGFAGGADPSGSSVSDLAFLEAGKSNEICYVPSGVYLLNNDITTGAWLIGPEVYFSGPGKINTQSIRFSNNIIDYGNGKGGRWNSDPTPAKIHRFRDRVFIGGSANNTGGISNQGENKTSWLDDPIHTGLLPGHASLEQNATLACVTETGLGAAVFATKSSDYKPNTGGHLALTSLALNDKNTRGLGFKAGGMAHYSVSILSQNADSDLGYSITGTESNIWNQKIDAGILDPYNFFPNNLIKNIWLSNGFPENEHSRDSLTASCAIGVLNNVIDTSKGKYKVGISFKATSLEGTDGISGRAIALSLARGHSFQWYYGEGSQGPYINSAVDSNTNEIQALVFSNNGTQFLNRSNQKPHFLIRSVPVSNNYPTVSPSVSGSPVMVSVSGDDQDIDLLLGQKGNGTVRIRSSIKPIYDNNCDFGAPELRGRTAYFGTGNINTSDLRNKPVLSSIDDKILDAWEKVNWSNKFKFDDAVEIKGEDGARWHFGLIAQHILAIFEEEEIDPFSLGLLCYDKWDEKYENVLQNPGAVTRKVRKIEVPVMVKNKVTVIIDGVEVEQEQERVKLKLVYVKNESGDYILNEDKTKKYNYVPVMETIEQEYDDPDEPVYLKVKILDKGDRYGIRYEEALSLEAALQRRNYKRQLLINEQQANAIELLVKRVEALERLIN